MTETQPAYERGVELFGRSYGWIVKPLTLQGLDGFGVYSWSGSADRGNLLGSWFLSHEDACRWVDVKIGGLS